MCVLAPGDLRRWTVACRELQVPLPPVRSRARNYQAKSERFAIHAVRFPLFSPLISEINLKKKNPKKNIILIDDILNSKKLSALNTELLKIKKALLIFDKADEKTMLDLLNKNDKQSKFYSLSMQILVDFYISKNEVSKANEIQKLVNEK